MDLKKIIRKIFRTKTWELSKKELEQKIKEIKDKKKKETNNG